MLTELIGISGGILILFSFTQNTSGKWSGFSIKYKLFNLLGAVFLFFYAMQKDAYAFILLNAIWIVIALYGIHIGEKKLYFKTIKTNKKKLKNSSRA